MTLVNTATFRGFLNPREYSFSDDKAEVTINGSDAQRSPRPWTTVTAPWRMEFGRLGAEDVWALEATEAAWGRSDFLPDAGVPLESWMTPIKGGEIQFLVVPAGEWPREA